MKFDLTMLVVHSLLVGFGICTTLLNPTWWSLIYVLNALWIYLHYRDALKEYNYTKVQL